MATQHDPGVPHLADEEELMSELPDQSGDVGNNGVLKQGEAAHDGCGKEERTQGVELKSEPEPQRQQRNRGVHLS